MFEKKIQTRRVLLFMGMLKFQMGLEQHQGYTQQSYKLALVCPHSGLGAKHRIAIIHCIYEHICLVPVSVVKRKQNFFDEKHIFTPSIRPDVPSRIIERERTISQKRENRECAFSRRLICYPQRILGVIWGKWRGPRVPEWVLWRDRRWSF